MKVSGQLHVLAALIPGKYRSTHLVEGWAGPGLAFRRRGKSLDPAGFRTPNRPARKVVTTRTMPSPAPPVSCTTN